MSSGCLFLPMRRLLRSEDFIYLVLMASWMGDSYHMPWEGHQLLDVIDYFAGAARIAKIGTIQGYTCRAYDCLYDTPPCGESTHSHLPRRSAFDFCGEAGFWFLNSTWIHNFPVNGAHKITFFWCKNSTKSDAFE